MAVVDPDFTELLTMTCTIQRNVAATPDESKKNAPPDWDEDFAEDVLCLLESRMIAQSRGTVQEQNSAKAVIEELNLMLPGDTDVTLADRIAAIVRTSDSAVIEAGPLYILELNRVEDPEEADEHHVELVLQRENDGL